mgnify:CR=1 FL=1
MGEERRGEGEKGRRGGAREEGLQVHVPFFSFFLIACAVFISRNQSRREREDRTGQDRTGQDRTGQDRTEKKNPVTQSHVYQLNLISLRDRERSDRVAHACGILDLHCRRAGNHSGEGREWTVAASSRSQCAVLSSSHTMVVSVGSHSKVLVATVKCQ